MSGFADDDQLAARPGSLKSPGRDEWAADIEATVDQDAGNADEAVRIPNQSAIFEPSPMAPIMCHESRKA